MKKSAKQTKATKQTEAALPWWLVSRPEGFYYRIRVEGDGMQEIGPFETKDEAIDGHTLAMNLYGIVTVNLMNGDGEHTWEWLRNPIAAMNEILTARGMNTLPDPFTA